MITPLRRRNGPWPWSLGEVVDSRSIQAMTHSEYWDDHARSYDRVTLLLNRRFAVMAGRVADIVAGSAMVLEIAAGTGLVTVHVARSVERVIATDLSHDMVALLGSRMEAAKRSNVSLVLADATRLPLSASSVDAVVIANLLHLLPEPQAVLRDSVRVLRPGGRLVAPTFCHGATWTSATISHTLGALVRFPVRHRFRGPDLRELVAGAGLRIDHDETFGGLLPIRLVAGCRRAL